MGFWDAFDGSWESGVSTDGDFEVLEDFVGLGAVVVLVSFVSLAF